MGKKAKRGSEGRGKMRKRGKQKRGREGGGKEKDPDCHVHWHYDNLASGLTI